MAEHHVTALHNVNSGILDVLEGYDTLRQKAAPDLLAATRDLEAMHRRHQADVAARLAALGEETDDGTVRGKVNRAVTTVRDWLGGLDGGAAGTVRTGEDLLLGVYDAALSAWPAGGAADDHALIQGQAAELRAAVAALPTG